MTKMPEHLDVAAGLAALADDLDFMGQADLADQARALAARLGYIVLPVQARHDLDFALAQQGGGAR